MLTEAQKKSKQAAIAKGNAKKIALGGKQRHCENTGKASEKHRKNIRKALKKHRKKHRKNHRRNVREAKKRMRGMLVKHSSRVAMMRESGGERGHGSSGG
ncbi:MAG: hypothetical protein MJ137_08445 [Clostridia bacterium]|nr:hypothetical protein [Clostridia bacterium]